jgi:hypothetical protein
MLATGCSSGMLQVFSEASLLSLRYSSSRGSPSFVANSLAIRSALAGSFQAEKR